VFDVGSIGLEPIPTRPARLARPARPARPKTTRCSRSMYGQTRYETGSYSRSAAHSIDPVHAAAGLPANAHASGTLPVSLRCPPASQAGLSSGPRQLRAPPNHNNNHLTAQGCRQRPRTDERCRHLHRIASRDAGQYAASEGAWLRRPRSSDRTPSASPAKALTAGKQPSFTPVALSVVPLRGAHVVLPRRYSPSVV
jgi:hypothetical protein